MHRGCNIVGAQTWSGRGTTYRASDSGTTVYLLNEQGEPVPDGKIGEIYIGGDGVGRGYRNLPDLTERSFLHDPFSAAPAARMYRTGDRGARRPDGEIEFRGRLDRQTKIRGFRMELDEIAGALNSYSSIDFATVVTGTSDSRGRISSLRTFCQR